jgi:hypothetical protein
MDVTAVTTAIGLGVAAVAAIGAGVLIVKAGAKVWKYIGSAL